MTFTLGIPKGSQSLNQTFQSIQDNFTNYKTVVGINHFAPNTANQGKHTFVEMPNFSGTPTTFAGEGSIFSRTRNGYSQVWYTPDAGAVRYQLTRCDDANFSTFAAYTPYGAPPAGFTQSGGWTFLPGGLLMQYGFYGKSGATGSSGSIEFPVNFSFFPYSIQLSLYRGSGDQSLTIDSGFNPTPSKFKFLTSSSGSDGIYWSAIGE